jgi:predicted dehydrogenase
MSGRELRLGVVGCGRLAESGYVPAIAAIEGVALVAVADPDPARRAHLARVASVSPAAPIEEFGDASAMASGTQLDAAVVASPVGAHVEDTRALAAAGVATLVEKPPASDAAGARALVAIDPTPWVAFNRRFDVGARRLRGAVPPTGDLDLRVEIHYRRASWRAHAVRDDALLDLGPHLVDWATWIANAGVVAVADATLERDRAVCTLTLTRGHARIVAECNRPHRELIEVRDGSGARVGRHHQGGIVSGLRARVARGPHPLVATLTGQLSEFAAAVRGEPAGSLGTVDQAVAVMAVIDAARQSAAEGGRSVPVDAAEAG